MSGPLLPLEACRSDSIYLASPYHHFSSRVRRQRAISAKNAAARLLSVGIKVYSPIVYGYEMERFLKRELPPALWVSLGLDMLGGFGQMWILQLDGWATSAGIASEVTLCEHQHRPIATIDPLTLLVTRLHERSI